jgi:hypothetical protein
MQLKKAVYAGDFKHIHEGSDSLGSVIADHSLHLNSALPHRKEIDNYNQDIVNHPDIKRAIASNELNLPGISPKVFFRTPHGMKMIKPYHEKIDDGTTDSTRFPFHGWSEMTSQALYHVSGLGKLHHKVHVVEHPTEQSQAHPMTVTHFDPQATHYIRDLANHAQPLPDHVYTNMAKMGLMDYLTNNVDRNLTNVLYQPDEWGNANRILAIDHGRAFNYKAPNRFQGFYTDQDHPIHYLHNTDPKSAQSKVIRPDRKIWQHESLEPAFRWWNIHSPKIKEEMHKHLSALLHPEVQHYVRSNFLERANVLDRLASSYLANPDPNLYDPFEDGKHHGEFLTHMKRFEPLVLPEGILI